MSPKAVPENARSEMVFYLVLVDDFGVDHLALGLACGSSASRSASSAGCVVGGRASGDASLACDLLRRGGVKTAVERLGCAFLIASMSSPLSASRSFVDLPR